MVMEKEKQSLSKSAFLRLLTARMKYTGTSAKEFIALSEIFVRVKGWGQKKAEKPAPEPEPLPILEPVQKELTQDELIQLIEESQK